MCQALNQAQKPTSRSWFQNETVYLDSGIVDLNLSMSPTCILDEWAGQAAYLSCVEKVNAELSAKIRK